MKTLSASTPGATEAGKLSTAAPGMTPVFRQFSVASHVDKECERGNMLTAQKEKNVLDGRIKVEDLLITDGGPHSKATRASHLPKPKFLSFFQVNIHLGPRSCQM